MALGGALAAALAIGLGACGGSDQATAGAKTEAAVGSGALTSEGNGASTPTPSCSEEVGQFVDSLAALRTELVAGLSYEQYVAEVEGIRGAYHRVPVAKLELECLRAAGTPAEGGLNKYIEAGNAWTECVETPGCEAATVEPALQSRWRQASKLLSEAQKGLRELAKGPGSS